MDNINEDLAWPTGNKILNRAHGFTHMPANVIAVFWYNLRTAKLIYSDDPASQHNDQELWQDDKKDKWIRGRVVKFSGYPLMSFYGREDRKVTKQQLRDLKTQLNNVLRVEIAAVIDYDGFEIDIN